MGIFFEIDAEDRAYAQGVFDDMLTEFGVPCKLTYQSAETICPNCIINPRTGESTNRYKTGGPIPFEPGEICPVCEGRGRIIGTGTNDLITLVVDWTPKPWMNIGSGTGAEGDRLVRVPAGMVTTRGFSKDLPKVLRSDNVVLDITNQYITNTYKLYGQPYMTGPITKNRYFMAIWERAG